MLCFQSHLEKRKVSIYIHRIVCLSEDMNDSRIPGVHAGTLESRFNRILRGRDGLVLSQLLGALVHSWSRTSTRILDPFLTSINLTRVHLCPLVYLCPFVYLNLVVYLNLLGHLCLLVCLTFLVCLNHIVHIGHVLRISLHFTMCMPKLK